MLFVVFFYFLIIKIQRYDHHYRPRLPRFRLVFGNVISIIYWWLVFVYSLVLCMYSDIIEENVVEKKNVSMKTIFLLLLFWNILDLKFFLICTMYTKNIPKMFRKYPKNVPKTSQKYPKMYKTPKWVQKPKIFRKLSNLETFRK